VTVEFQGAVEGDLDEAVLRRLVAHVGAEIGVVYGRNGKDRLKSHIGGYNEAARRFRWAVLVDLDHDHDCAPALRSDWLPEPSRFMCFRVAVREVEAWLLADAESIARFLGVSRALIPLDPEQLGDPKQTLTNLASRSRKRNIREALPPVPGSGRSVGVLYNPLMGSYARELWRPDVAAQHCDSLRRCLAGLDDLQCV